MAFSPSRADGTRPALTENRRKSKGKPKEIQASPQPQPKKRGHPKSWTKPKASQRENGKNEKNKQKKQQKDNQRGANGKPPE